MRTIGYVLVLFLSAYLACSPDDLDPITPPGTNDPADTVVSDEERYIVLQACKLKYHTMGDLNAPSNKIELVNWLRAQPLFIESGISAGGSIYAYFKDGRIVTFHPNDVDVNESPVTLPEITGRIAEGDNIVSGRIEELPASKKVMLYFGLPRKYLYPDMSKWLKKLFSKSYAQYEVEALDASIDNLKKAQDVGIMYINTHGRSIEPPPETKLPANRGGFTLWTTDSMTLSNEVKYHEEFRRGYLEYGFNDQNPKRIEEGHYCITDGFVRNYMTFSKNALLYLDACESMTPASTYFRESFFLRTDQTGTYVGWTTRTRPEDYAPTTTHVFDRLLGTNLKVIPQEDPEIRPFDMQSIIDDLPYWKLGVSPVFGGKLAMETRTSNKVIITPNIAKVAIVEDVRMLVLTGMFGEDPGDRGVVKYDGQVIPVQTWSSDLIIGFLPKASMSSTAHVMVSVDGHESNLVPITTWTIPITIRKEDRGVIFETNLTLYLRADIHQYRKVLGQPPIKALPEWIEPTYFYPFHEDSNGTYSISGGRYYECNQSVCLFSYRQTVTSKSGTLNYQNVLQNNPNFIASYRWNDMMDKLDVNLSARVTGVNTLNESVLVCPDETRSASSTFDNIQFVNVPEDIASIAFDIDDEYNIVGGTKSITVPSEIPDPCGSSGTKTVTMTWKKSTGQNPPVKATQSRVAID